MGPLKPYYNQHGNIVSIVSLTLPFAQGHRGSASVWRADPGRRYVLGLLCVLTTAARNRALRSINSPVC